MDWRCVALTAILFCAVARISAAAATPEEIDASFYPYKKGVLTAPGYQPGVVIAPANAETHKDILDPGSFSNVRDKWIEIKTGPTESFALHPNYVEATRKYADGITMGNEPGEIHGAVAGRPFPQEPSLSDPRAGEKILWNYRYGFSGGDGVLFDPLIIAIREIGPNSEVRQFRLKASFLKFAQRTVNPPIPSFAENPAGVYRATYSIFLDPFDIKNSQYLGYSYLDDSHRDDAWFYLGFQRRVRRIPTGQTADAYFGTGIMIEDFEGYNARVRDYRWTFKGTAHVLLPMYRHNELQLSAEPPLTDDGWRMVAFGGRGGCYPAVSYQLRKTYIVEGKPAEPEHPVGRRVLWVDAETATIPRSMLYDRKGDLWKTFLIGKANPEFHLPINKGTGVPLDDSASLVDIQAGYCTTLQFRARIAPDELQQNQFSVQNMRVTGQ